MWCSDQCGFEFETSLEVSANFTVHVVLWAKQMKGLLPLSIQSVFMLWPGCIMLHHAVAASVKVTSAACKYVSQHHCGVDV